MGATLLLFILTQMSVSTAVSEPVAAGHAPAPAPVSEPVAAKNVRKIPTKISQLPKAWRRLAWCESRYQLHAVSPSGKHFGLWQLHRGFYAHFHINPKTATFSQQWVVAQYVYKRQGAGAWSCARSAGLT